MEDNNPFKLDRSTEQNLTSALKSSVQSKFRLADVEEKLEKVKRMAFIPPDPCSSESNKYESNQNEVPFSLKTNEFYKSLPQPWRRFQHEQDRISSLNRYKRREKFEKFERPVQRKQIIPVPEPVSSPEIRLQPDMSTDKINNRHKRVASMNVDHLLASARRNLEEAERLRQRDSAQKLTNNEIPESRYRPAHQKYLARKPVVGVKSNPVPVKQRSGLTTSQRINRMRQRASAPVPTRPEPPNVPVLQQNLSTVTLKHYSPTPNIPSISESEVDSTARTTHSQENSAMESQARSNSVSSSDKESLLSPPLKRKHASLIKKSKTEVIQKAPRRTEEEANELRKYIARKKEEQRRRAENPPREQRSERVREYDQDKVKQYIKNKKQQRLQAIKDNAKRKEAQAADRLEKLGTVYSEQKQRSRIPTYELILREPDKKKKEQTKEKKVEKIRQRLNSAQDKNEGSSISAQSTLQSTPTLPTPMVDTTPPPSTPIGANQISVPLNELMTMASAHTVTTHTVTNCKYNVANTIKMKEHTSTSVPALVDHDKIVRHENMERSFRGKSYSSRPVSEISTPTTDSLLGMNMDDTDIESGNITLGSGAALDESNGRMNETNGRTNDTDGTQGQNLQGSQQSAEVVRETQEISLSHSVRSTSQSIRTDNPMPGVSDLRNQLKSGLNYLQSVENNLRQVLQIENAHNVVEAQINTAALQSRETENIAQKESEKREQNFRMEGKQTASIERNERRNVESPEEQVNLARIVSEAASGAATQAVLAALRETSMQQQHRRCTDVSTEMTPRQEGEEDESLTKVSESISSVKTPTSVSPSEVISEVIEQKSITESIQEEIVRSEESEIVEEITGDKNSGRKSSGADRVSSRSKSSESESSVKQDSWKFEKEVFGDALASSARRLSLGRQKRESMLKKRARALKNLFLTQIALLHEQKRSTSEPNDVVLLSSREDSLLQEYKKEKEKIKNEVDREVSEIEFSSTQLQEIGRLQSITLGLQWQLDQALKGQQAGPSQGSVDYTHAYLQTLQRLANPDVSDERSKTLEKRRKQAEKLLRIHAEFQRQEAEVLRLEQTALLAWTQPPRQTKLVGRRKKQEEKEVEELSQSNESSQDIPTQISVKTADNSTNTKAISTEISPAAEELSSESSDTSRSGQYDVNASASASHSSQNNTDRSNSQRSHTEFISSSVQQETQPQLSESNSLDTRIQALRRELKGRRDVADTLKKEHQRRTKLHLKNTEASLNKQIQAYDRFISQTQTQLDELERRQSTGEYRRPSTPPRIRSPSLSESEMSPRRMRSPVKSREGSIVLPMRSRSNSLNLEHLQIASKRVLEEEEHLKSTKEDESSEAPKFKLDLNQILDGQREEKLLDIEDVKADNEKVDKGTEDGISQIPNDRDAEETVHTESEVSSLDSSPRKSARSAIQEDSIPEEIVEVEDNVEEVSVSAESESTTHKPSVTESKIDESSITEKPGDAQSIQESLNASLHENLEEHLKQNLEKSLQESFDENKENVSHEKSIEQGSINLEDNEKVLDEKRKSLGNSVTDVLLNNLVNDAISEFVGRKKSVEKRKIDTLEMKAERITCKLVDWLALEQIEEVINQQLSGDSTAVSDKNNMSADGILSEIAPPSPPDFSPTHHATHTTTTPPKSPSTPKSPQDRFMAFFKETPLPKPEFDDENPWIDDDFGMISPKSPNQSPRSPRRRLSIDKFTTEVFSAVAHTKEEITPILEECAKCIWDRRRFGEEIRQIEPPSAVLVNPKLDSLELSINKDSDRAYRRVLFDWSCEIAANIFDQSQPALINREALTEGPLLKLNRYAKNLPKNETELQQLLNNEILTALNLNVKQSDGRLPRERIIANKRLDTVDAILLPHMYQEEKEWVDYYEEEQAVKEELYNSICKELCSEAISDIISSVVTQ